MTKIKLCGLSRCCDINAANALKPEYVGFVFAPKSRRYVTYETAEKLKKRLAPEILAVGVFVNEAPGMVARLLDSGIIDIAQLHGSEDEHYIKELRTMTDKPLIKAFQINTKKDMIAARNSSADYVLLDSGSGGTGTVFDWSMLKLFGRPFFLAGGLNAGNVKNAVKEFQPYAVDVSSGIETAGRKDERKMKEFVHAVRSVEGKEEIQ